uniref:Gamma-aminobutyric acid type B receptor subunit 2 n=1 Tax=Acrobeloides nanus TaxID=290746 RepID=A0A914DKM6_9BILA
MSAESRPFALFGDVCTNVNEPVAMASKYWNMLHLSYAETHPKFATSDSKELYPTFFRMVPGDRNLIAARCHLLLSYNWTRVGTIKQSDEPRYALPHETLTTKLENVYGIRVLYTAGLSVDQIHNIGFELDELKRRDAHIIIGDFSPSFAVKILCEAHSKEMYGTNYVWILPGYHEDKWWKNVEETNCTQSDLEEVLKWHFALEFAPERPNIEMPVVGNKSVHQVRDELKEFCDHRRCIHDIHSSYAYDGIWTLALALNRTITDGDFLPNRTFEAINANAFEGLTGLVKFENNERLGLVYIYQWWDGSYNKIGHYDSAEDVFVIRSHADWTPPLDATVVVRERLYVSLFLFAIMSGLALIGVILALLFLAVNVKYRNHRIIKMSSPNMNNLIIVGSICTYISVLLLGVDTRVVSESGFQKLCYAKTWVLSVGFTLAFGSMFSKTWRVHSIFTNIRKDKKAIKDYQLFLIVALLLGIDAFILCLWAIISPFRFTVTVTETIHSKNILIVPELERCQSDYSIYFQVVFYVIKGMLMIFGCFLAWETRAVNVPALNDSKYIGMSVYNVVVMCVIGLSLTFILQERVNEAFALTSFFIIFCTTLTLSLVFVPKIIELLRSPRGGENQRYRKGMMKSMVGKNGADKLQRSLSFGADGIKEKIAQIEEENMKLHQILVTKSGELWDLLERLRQLGENVRDQKGSRGLCCVGAQLTSSGGINLNEPSIIIGEEMKSNSAVLSTTQNGSATQSIEKIDQTKAANDNGANNNMDAILPRNHLRKPSSEPTSPFDMKANNNMAKPSPSAYFSTSGLSVMVMQKPDSGWPWSDPNQPTTML